MGTIRRIAFSTGIIFAASIAGTWWLYFLPSVKPLASKYAGPFTSQWELVKWAFPVSCLLLILVACAYIVFGGIQQERGTERTVRRQR